LIASPPSAGLPAISQSRLDLLAGAPVHSAPFLKQCGFLSARTEANVDWTTHTASPTAPHETGLPRRILRHLFLSRRIRPGYRILDVGCGSGALSRFLDPFAVDVVGLDASPAQIARARRKSPELEFHCIDSGPLPVVGQQFDLVLARKVPAYAGDLMCQTALTATANLLACLRPGGELLIISRQEPTAEDRLGGHRRSCFARHLGSFPGICRVLSLPDPWWNWESVRRLCLWQPRGSFSTAVLRIPEVPRTYAQWYSIAVAACQSSQSRCCPWGQPESPVRRIAKVA
jgi:SAM-dependent methyltransferase